MSAQSIAARTARLVGAGLVGLVLIVAGARAQVSENVDPGLLEFGRLHVGDTLRVCLRGGSTTAAFDRAIGEALADRLLLSAAFTEMRTGYGIDGEYVAEDLFIALTNECDVALGMGISAGLYPVELTATRPYASFGYVLLVLDPAIETIEDIPVEDKIGSLVGSYADSALARYISVKPQAERWVRLPYGDQNLMLERLVDGTISGIVVFGPNLLQLRQARPEGQDLLVRSPAPMQLDDSRLGGVMLAKNAYLRTVMDEAIAAMVADGTVDAILAETGFDAVPSAPGEEAAGS